MIQSPYQHHQATLSCKVVDDRRLKESKKAPKQKSRAINKCLLQLRIKRYHEKAMAKAFTANGFTSTDRP